jgi:hypothetical protein
LPRQQSRVSAAAMRPPGACTAAKNMSPERASDAPAMLGRAHGIRWRRDDTSKAGRAAIVLTGCGGTGKRPFLLEPDRARRITDPCEAMC